MIKIAVFGRKVKEGKAWIYENKTNIDLAKILIEMGIAKEDIELGYLPPILRQISIKFTLKNTPFKWLKSLSIVSKVAFKTEAVAAIHKSFGQSI